MSWLDETLDRLAENPRCGYRPDSAAAVEPTALASLALIAHRRESPAMKALSWLEEIQSDDGSLGVDASLPRPCWPTGWAILAWKAAGQMRFSAPADRAVRWVLATRSTPGRPTPHLKHDTSLVGWPWVASTNAWVEPTAINLMALKASGHAKHDRCRQAVELLLDRALPSGGWNCGVTIVLGNTTRPNIQTTGLALAALAGERKTAGHVKRSLGYLRRTWSDRTTTASLCYALIGAAAHGCRPKDADRWLETACRRTFQRDRSPHTLALAALAHCGEDCPWFKTTSTTVATTTE